MAARVAIIGYGEMGHAMEYLLAPGHDVVIWNRHPLPDRETVQLEAAISGADYVVYCVPVSALAALADRIRPLLAPGSISLSMAKGLDDNGRTAASVFDEHYGARPAYGLMYGPMISEEIRSGRRAFAQLGSLSADVYRRVVSLFAHSPLYFEYTRDICGISWSAVLKNVYAMLIGAMDALDSGDNMRGFLTVAAMQEMDVIVTRQGGSAATAHRLAGLGDLVTTATSPDSHHYALGGRLVRGERGDISGEGVHTLAMARKFGLIDPAEFPLFGLVQSLIDEPERIEERLAGCLERRFRRPGGIPP